MTAPEAVAYSPAGAAAPADPEALLREHMPMIRHHAEQLMRRTPASVELEDLVQAGVVGLLDAASRFDPKKGVPFGAFASFRVRGAMTDFLRSMDWMPRALRDSAKDVQEAMRTLEQRLGRPASEEEIAAHLGLGLEEYRERLARVRAMSVVSFDDLPVRNEAGDLLDVLETIAGDPADEPEHRLALAEFTDRLARAIEALPARERVLLTLYYFEELSMKEVALILGVTESRISQLHSQMVLRLRAHLGLDE